MYDRSRALEYFYIVQFTKHREERRKSLLSMYEQIKVPSLLYNLHIPPNLHSIETRCVL